MVLHMSCRLKRHNSAQPIFQGAIIKGNCAPTLFHTFSVVVGGGDAMSIELLALSI